MYYVKKEEYTFRMPQEYKGYLAFKNRLKESGVHFVDTGGFASQVIEIRTNGAFKLNEDGSFDLDESK